MKQTPLGTFANIVHGLGQIITVVQPSSAILMEDEGEETWSRI